LGDGKTCPEMKSFWFFAFR